MKKATKKMNIVKIYFGIISVLCLLVGWFNYSLGYTMNAGLFVIFFIFCMYYFLKKEQ
ncbi:MAG: hypothetical protein HUJ53_04855 [Holdemanella sp.]|nr:hypothetical protein [Holdemanella sp.]